MGKIALYSAVICLTLVAFQGKASAFTYSGVQNASETANSTSIHEVAKKKVKKAEETQPVPPKRIFRNDKRQFKYKRFRRAR